MIRLPIPKNKDIPLGSSSSHLYQDFLNIASFLAVSAITRRCGERALISSHDISSRLIYKHYKRCKIMYIIYPFRSKIR